MVGSMKTVALLATILVATLAALVYVGTAVSATSYCSNAGWWEDYDEASDKVALANDLKRADDDLGAYSEMYGAKLTLQYSDVPCHPKAKEVRRLAVVRTATWATALKQSYLENYSGALRTYKQLERWQKKLMAAMKRVPAAAL